MRILHVQKGGRIAGSERHLLTLLPALADRGIDVRMCVLKAGREVPFVEELRARGVPTIVLPAGPRVNPPLAVALAWVIRREAPDIVHTHLIHADFYGLAAARALGVPAVSSMHSSHAFYKRQPYRLIGQANGRLASLQIAVSCHIARFLHVNSLVPPNRIRVVPYGLDPAGWSFPDDDRRRARSDLSLPDDAVAVGIFARLIPGKGHEVLIEAVSAVRREGHKVCLMIAGEGPSRYKLERLVAATGNADAITFLGFVSDVRAVMNACDIVAFPTLPELSEGFGMVALEAMAAARTVVSSDVGALPELVADGVTGLVVPAGSAVALGRAIVSLASDPNRRRRMGDAARVRAREMFGLEPMVRRTIGVYAEAI